MCIYIYMFAIRWWLANLIPERKSVYHLPSKHSQRTLSGLAAINTLKLHPTGQGHREQTNQLQLPLRALIVMVRGEMSWEHGHSLARLPQGCDQCPVQGSSTVYFKCHQSDSAHSVCLKLVHDECKDEQSAPLVDEIFNILVQGAGKGKKGMFCSWNWVAETGRHFHKDWTSHGIKPAHASFCRQWRKLWRCFEGTPTSSRKHHASQIWLWKDWGV